MNMKDKCAIVGLGYTPQGRVPNRTPRSLYLEAAGNAIKDAGLTNQDIDGVVIEHCWTDPTYNSWTLQQDLGLTKAKLVSNVEAMGASCGANIQYASMAIAAGMASCVLCAYVELSLTPPPGSPVPYRGGLPEATAYGLFGAMGAIGLAAQYHMRKYGTTQEQLGTIAVTFRKHASMNPIAQMRTPITMEDYMNSKWIAKPFHLLDCCLVSDGGRAIVVTSAERAKSLRHPPVYIMGMGQGHNVLNPLRKEDMLDCGVAQSGETAFRMAGVTPKDMDLVCLYDAATYNVITQLEEYGFCKRGEGGPFVEGGRIEIGGELPINPSGGQMSEVYLQGWTGPHELVRQLRGDCGERQVKGAEIGMVSNQGGTMNSHSTLILRR